MNKRQKKKLRKTRLKNCKSYSEYYLKYLYTPLIRAEEIRRNELAELERLKNKYERY